MTNLGIMGGVSLGTINQWISVIDTNLTNSKRIGYKETRVSMTSGEVNTIGMTQGPGKVMPIAFPSASLLIGKTQILDYVQGNLTQTGQVTDFALNGRGYFVVEDKLGNRYATRDGQFNFDTDGYLVTQEGLRVLTTGLDYVRVPASETFAVNSEGESQVLGFGLNNFNPVFNPAASGGMSDISQSKYGTKKLLVIDIPDADKLVYSKYGYTKFELGKRVPIIVRNDFSSTMDGINPYLVSENMNQYFKHDLKSGTVKIATHEISSPYNNTYVQALVTGQRYGDFNASVDFHVRENASTITSSTTEGPFGLTIGKQNVDTNDNGSAYFVGVLGSNLVIRKNGAILTSDSLSGDLSTDLWNTPNLDPSKMFTLNVNAVNGRINATLTKIGSTTPLATVNLNTNDYFNGYIGIGGSMALSPGAVSPVDNIIEVTNLTVIERNADSEYTTNVLQQNVRDIWKEGANAQIRETMVMQQYVEESTSTLADTLPLLSHAQKMFGAISKVISVYNSITDDMNNTIR